MNSYHSTTYQIVFGTKYRKENMIKKNRRKVYQYIYGICRNHGCFVYRINGVSDHLHIVLSIPPKVAASALIKDLKQYSSRMIKRYNLFPNWGGWQTGYFLGTYAASARKGLITYVINQEIHHGEDENPEAESYQEEMIRLLEENNIEWDEKYLE